MSTPFPLTRRTVLAAASAAVAGVLAPFSTGAAQAYTECKGSVRCTVQTLYYYCGHWYAFEYCYDAITGRFCYSQSIRIS